MIRCPHCEKGMLWGIYLDIPPEMKSGEAQWIACEPPDANQMVTCPSCQEKAGLYGKLYRADSDSRKDEREEIRREKLALVETQSLNEMFILGIEFTGSFHRENFFEKAWKTLEEWLQTLRKDKVYPRSLFKDLDEMLPQAVGVRLDHPSQGNPIRCRYIAGVVINSNDSEKLPEKFKHRLENPEYNDPKLVRLIKVLPGTFARFSFRGSDPKEFFEVDKFLVKEWLTVNRHELDENPALEFYHQRPKSWPPKKNEQGIIEIQYFLPIKALPEEDFPSESEESLNQFEASY